MVVGRDPSFAATSSLVSAKKASPFTSISAVIKLIVRTTCLLVFVDSKYLGENNKQLQSGNPHYRDVHDTDTKYQYYRY